MKVFFANLRKVAPDFIHECPFEGAHEALDFPFVHPAMSAIPKGTYRLKTSLSDEADLLLIFAVNFTAS